MLSRANSTTSERLPDKFRIGKNAKISPDSVKVISPL